MPERVTGVDWRGYISAELDTDAFLGEIDAYEKPGVIPFYQSEPRRRTFYDSARGFYIKLEDEEPGWPALFHWALSFNWAADRYFRYYKALKKLGVGTPEVMACFKMKESSGAKSVIVTKGVKNARPLNELLRAVESRDIRFSIIKELARVSALIHRAGYYFSLDLRNILAAASGGDVGLFVIDLEHMKYAGIFARRRLRRNLSRFRSGFLSLPYSTEGEWLEFIRQYRAGYNGGRAG